MAQTAKILNPMKRIFVPSVDAGCSLSDSIKKEDVINLRKEYPDAPVVTYINTEAEVKAYSDVVVTSSNAEKILKNLYKNNRRIIFIPDKFMGSNIAARLNKKVGDELILWNGSCIVHEKFDASVIKEYRKKYPNMMVLAHSECPSEIIENVDFMGSTADMLEQIKNTNAENYMLVTECGLGELAMTMFPHKKFIAMCRLCPYMKMTSLENILDTLKNLPAENEVILSADLIEKSKKSIDMMFELAR
jgi:quinolinate synthase